MKTPTRFVKLLTEEHNRLVENHQKHENFPVRNSSRPIRLSAEGYSIDEIGVICQSHAHFSILSIVAQQLWQTWHQSLPYSRRYQQSSTASAVSRFLPNRPNTE